MDHGSPFHDKWGLWKGRQLSRLLRASSTSRDASAKEVSKRPLNGSFWRNISRNVKKAGIREEKRSILTNKQESSHHKSSILWTDNYWVTSQSQEHLEQMMKELIKEAVRLGPEPKPASLWSGTGRHEGEDEHWTAQKFYSKKTKNSPIRGHIFNSSGKSQESPEERMQKAHKARWRGAKINKRKDVLWRIMCRSNGGTRMRKLVVESNGYGKI